MKIPDWSIRSKLVVGIISSVSIAVFLSVGVLYTQMQGIINEAQLRELNRLFQSLEAEVASRATTAETLSALVANIPEVRQQFSDRNRDALAQLFVPPFKSLKKDYGFRQFQFHEPNAHSFLRVHKPKKFGDDLSSFRKTVVETNAKKQPIKGIEKGVAGLGIRGISPVSDLSGQHIGSIEFGLSLKQSFFDEFKKKYGVDVNFYQMKGNKVNTFAATQKGVELSQEHYKRALSGEAILAKKGEKTTIIRPIKDFSGKPIGVVMVLTDNAYYTQQTSASALNSVLVLAIAIVIAAIFSYLMLRITIKPIQEITQAMEEIANGDGDLTSRLSVKRQDEVSALASAFNVFAEKLHSIISEVSTNVDVLKENNSETQAIIEQTKQSSNEQHSEVDSAAAASTELTSIIDNISDNTQDAANTAEQAMDLSQESNQAIQTALKSVEQLTNVIGQTNDAFTSLEHESNQISIVLNEIQEIAEQTNLLALNAAIEAARAGEQGRGFAVVAGEVRTLANRTQQSTESIEASIAKLQKSVSESSIRMKESVSYADVGLDKSRHVESSLNDMITAITQLKKMNSDISQATREQSKTAQMVDESLHKIKQLAEKTLNNSKGCFDNSHQLAHVMGNLVQQIDKFKI